jgi:glycerol-3-phosphate acyltransferase PlsY
MDVLYAALLILAAFLLGACPFSVWVGRWFLKKDITKYGDGNPGSANVFRAGKNINIGLLAVLLDIVKGIPFVYISYAVFDLSAGVIAATGLAAILGHAFSPFLRFRGGKSVAVTFGVIIALPQVDILVVFTLLTVLGFLFIEQHSWVVIPGPAGTLVYLLMTRGVTPESLLMGCILALFIVRQYEGLRTLPRFRVKLLNWLQSRSRQA